ncbi:MAG: hypothetical protein JNM19_00060, partial [Chitinophagaceae bacterium]|nr:hypothetical protein [Chitinophagaceae bacterium]
ERDFPYQSGVDYIMGPDGKLKDINGNPVMQPVNNDYRYNSTDSANKETETNDIQQQIDQEKRRQEQIKKENEESQRKLKELEEKIKASKSKPISLKKVVQNNSKETYAGGPSPVASLVEWF